MKLIKEALWEEVGFKPGLKEGYGLGREVECKRSKWREAETKGRLLHSLAHGPFPLFQRQYCRSFRTLSDSDLLPPSSIFQGISELHCTHLYNPKLFPYFKSPNVTTSGAVLSWKVTSPGLGYQDMDIFGKLWFYPPHFFWLWQVLVGTGDLLCIMWDLCCVAWTL